MITDFKAGTFLPRVWCLSMPWLHDWITSSSSPYKIKRSNANYKARGE